MRNGLPRRKKMFHAPRKEGIKIRVSFLTPSGRRVSYVKLTRRPRRIWNSVRGYYRSLRKKRERDERK